MTQDDRLRAKLAEVTWIQLKDDIKGQSTEIIELHADSHIALTLGQDEEDIFVFLSGKVVNSFHLSQTHCEPEYVWS